MEQGNRRYAALRRAVLMVVVAVLGGLLAPVPGGAASGTWTGTWTGTAYRDTRVDESRTVPAYLRTTDPDRVVQLHSVRFWARAGERRYAAADLTGWQSATTPDRLLMAAVSVTCSPGTGRVQSAGATQNLLRGTATRFTPRLVFVAARTGMAACTLVAVGGRPRPVPTGRPWANAWRASDGSELAVSRPVPRWARTLTAGSRSRVLDRGERWSPIVRTVTVGPVRSFTLTSDHKLTTCSAVGGSRDDSTLGRNLCEGRVSLAGSRVRLLVTAQQLTRDGGRCGGRRAVVDRTVFVDDDVHHRMLFTSARVPVSRAAGCVPRFGIVGRLVNVGGADVVVHAPAERTSVLPR